MSARAERVTRKLREAWAKYAPDAPTYLGVQNRRSELRAIMRHDDAQHEVDFDDVLAVARGEATMVEVGDMLTAQYEIPEHRPDINARFDLGGEA